MGSTLDELTLIIRTSGWTSLFSGLSASLVGTTVSQGVYFYLYSLLRQAAVRRRTASSSSSTTTGSRAVEISIGESLFVAALAGMGNVLLTNPIWMIATRMQAHQRRSSTTKPSSPSPSSSSPLPAAPTTGAVSSTPSTSTSTSTKETEEAQVDVVVVVDEELPPPGPLSVAREVFSEYGIKGFWNGCGASLVMVINPTIQYAFYEWLSAARTRVRNQNSSSKSGGGGAGQQRASAAEIFLTSALAKAGATVLTYPLLTVKTRMMSARKSDAEMQYKSVADAVAQIAKREGLGGYYRGMRTKILQSVLAAALLFMCKEKITEKISSILKKKDVGVTEGVLLAALVLERQAK